MSCNRLIIISTQIIHKKKTSNKGNVLNLTVQDLEKCSSAVQQLAPRCWHRVNRQEEELLTGGGREGGRWESEGLSAIGDRGQDAILLTSDADSTGSGSLLDSILCTFLKGLPRWLSHEETACHFRRHRRQGLDPWVRKTPLE